MINIAAIAYTLLQDTDWATRPVVSICGKKKNPNNPRYEVVKLKQHLWRTQVLLRKGWSWWLKKTRSPLW